MVSVGFSAPPVVNWLPSEMNKLATSWVWPNLLQTPSCAFSLWRHVNVASRLEALTRALDCALVASDDLVKRANAELGSADAVFRPLTTQAPQTIRA